MDQDEVERLRAENERLRQDHESLKRYSEALEIEREDLGLKTAELMDEVERLRAENEMLEAGIEAFRAENERLRTALAGLLDRLDHESRGQVWQETRRARQVLAVDIVPTGAQALSASEGTDGAA